VLSKKMDRFVRNEFDTGFDSWTIEQFYRYATFPKASTVQNSAHFNSFLDLNNMKIHLIISEYFAEVQCPIVRVF
jgi:hypothetical protein